MTVVMKLMIDIIHLVVLNMHEYKFMSYERSIDCTEKAIHEIG